MLTKGLGKGRRASKENFPQKSALLYLRLDSPTLTKQRRIVELNDKFVFFSAQSYRMTATVHILTYCNFSTQSKTSHKLVKEWTAFGTKKASQASTNLSW